jgi:hypothetical protein
VLPQWPAPISDSLSIRPELTQPIPLTPSLCIDADFIVPRIEVETWLFSPVNMLVPQNGPPHRWLTQLVEPPVQSNASANFDLVFCAKNNVLCQKIESTQFIFLSIFVKKPPGEPMSIRIESVRMVRHDCRQKLASPRTWDQWHVLPRR